MSYINYCSRCALDKICEFALLIAVQTGGLAKNRFWLVATQKKRIGEQLNYFWNMYPKPFSWAKNKRKLALDGKSRGSLLARAALKCLHFCLTIISVPRRRCYLILKVLIQCSVQPDNWLILQRNFYTSIAFGLTEHHELNNSSYLFAILILLWGLLRINSSSSWYAARQ